MKNILLIGAGRSTLFLTEYLQEHAAQEDWRIIIADQSLQGAQKRASQSERAQAVQLDVANQEQRQALIKESDIVVSMLPAHMHVGVAADCIQYGKHMVTASYISPEMEAMQEDAQKAGVVMINEIGVDPGIDHLSAMQLLDKVRDQGAELKLFESFTGGLVAPESDNNPWNYKFSWNPRNVVLAGAGSAVKFRQEGQFKYIPYQMLFRRTERIDIDGYGRFEGYPNRDSLKYRQVYGLENIPTIFRGTLRRPGFCRSWDTFVKLGMTEDSYYIEQCRDMTYRDFTNLFLAFNPNDSVELKLMHYLNIPQDSDLMDKLSWTGIFEKKKIGLDKATPAQILQKILEEKWQMEPDDKDMIVMFHKLGYELNGQLKMIESAMVTQGENQERTAMARTVGIPVGIAVRQILKGTINTPGIFIPTSREIYEPMLKELREHRITFTEKEVPYQGY